MQWCHLWWCQLHVMLTVAEMASLDQEHHVAPEFDGCNLRNEMKVLIMSSRACDTNGCANGDTWQKCHVAPYFNCLANRNVIGPIDGAVCWIWLWCQCQCQSNDQKSNVASNFNCLDLWNAMVPMKKPLALHDANPSSNDVTWWRKSCCT